MRRDAAVRGRGEERDRPERGAGGRQQTLHWRKAGSNTSTVRTMLCDDDDEVDVVLSQACEGSRCGWCGTPCCIYNALRICLLLGFVPSQVLRPLSFVIRLPTPATRPFLLALRSGVRLAVVSGHKRRVLGSTAHSVTNECSDRATGFAPGALFLAVPHRARRGAGLCCLAAAAAAAVPPGLCRAASISRLLSRDNYSVVVQYYSRPDLT